MAISNQDLIEGMEKLGYYKQKWELLEDGDAFSTNSSLLQPVLHMEDPAMLKIPIEQEERWGILLMDWWNGDGAARVLKYDDNALLMERAVAGASLVEMVKNGYDDEASRIICSVAAKLHAPRD